MSVSMRPDLTEILSQQSDSNHNTLGKDNNLNQVNQINDVNQKITSKQLERMEKSETRGNLYLNFMKTANAAAAQFPVSCLTFGVHNFSRVFALKQFERHQHLTIFDAFKVLKQECIEQKLLHRPQTMLDRCGFHGAKIYNVWGLSTLARLYSGALVAVFYSSFVRVCGGGGYVVANDFFNRNHPDTNPFLINTTGVLLGLIPRFFFGMPIDNLKMNAIRQGSYSSGISVMKGNVQRYGVIPTLYRGGGIMMGQSIVRNLMWWNGYGYFKHIAAKNVASAIHLSSEEKEKYLKIQNTLAGIYASLFVSTTYFLKNIKSHAQSRVNKLDEPTLMNVVKDIWSRGGILALYKGYGVRTLLDLFTSAAFVTLWEYFNAQLEKENSEMLG